MSQTVSATDSRSAGELREAMVDGLRTSRLIASEAIAEAFSAVPRHLFAPGESLEAAYAVRGTVVPKRDADGRLVSVVSAPEVQAMMLGITGVQPGMRVLEIGSGGYNAALIAELAGPGGQVTTLDIDPEVTSRARACLDAAGYPQVRVVLGDAEAGVPEGAPYDRVIVTAGAWDIPPAWISQLAADGRLVVPLRLRGLTRTVAFERDGDGLVSRHYQLAAFVPFQGDGAHADHRVTLECGVTLQSSDGPVTPGGAALAAALESPALELWTGAEYDFPDEVGLYVTLNSPGAVQLHATQEAVDRGIVARRALAGVPALVSEDSIAYRTAREAGADPVRYESGVIAYGPQAALLAEQYAQLLRRWARDYFRRGSALFRYLPGSPPPGPLAAGAVAKRHGVVTVTWP